MNVFPIARNRHLDSALRAIWFAIVILLVVALSFAFLRGSSAQDESPPFDPSTFAPNLELVIDGLNRPVQIVDPGDDSGRMFIVEQGGTVRILSDGSLLDQPFLDITGQVSTGNEQGLLSIAFHPAFKDNGLFFIDYTDADGNSQIEKWTVSKDDPNLADPSSAQTILAVDQPFPNHNGGLVLFGPDRKLYIGFGDGGSQGDPNRNGQNVNVLLGKILRIDIDTTTGDLPYGIPDDNPFAGRDDARGEVWAYGLRNPWRFSFDRATDDLYVGDVGQNQYEEVDFSKPGEQAGTNFGWNVMEAATCYEADGCDQNGLNLPIFSYSHDEGGCSVTGGYLYRGSATALEGVYLAADYCSGLLWGVGRDASGDWVSSQPVATGLQPSSFGEDATGEVYLVDLNGGVFRITGS